MNFFKPMLVICCLVLFASSAFADEFLSVPKTQNAQQKRTVELVKTYYQAINKKDMHQFFSIMNDDVVHDLNQGPTESGRKKFQEFMDKVNQSFNEDIEQIIILVSNDGKYAAAQWIDHGRYFKDYPGLDVPAKNQTYEIRGANFFEITNHKLSRVTTYYNLTDFMEQIKK